MGKNGTGGKFLFKMILLSLEKSLRTQINLQMFRVPLRILYMFPQTLHLLTKVGIPSRNFAFICKTFVSPNFAFAHKSCVPTKKLHSLAKFGIPPRNFVSAFAFSQKNFRLFEKGLHYPKCRVGVLGLGFIFTAIINNLKCTWWTCT